MAYDSSDVTSSANRVRLLVGDTDTSYPLFTDAEVTALLALESDVRLAAALACDALAARAARSAVSYSVLGDLSVNRLKQPDVYRDMAKQFRADAQAQPGHHIQEIGWKIDPATGQDTTDYDEANDDLDPFVGGLNSWNEGG